MNAADPATVARPDGWTPADEARWQAVYARLKKTEGGLVDHKNDPGGITKYGISLRFLVVEGRIDANRDGLADFDLNRDGKIDALDVKLLTPEHAEALYLRLFWIDTGFWNLPHPIGAAVFDLGVNAGTGTAITVLQRAANRICPKAPLATDGGLGPKTRARVEEALKVGPLLTEFRNEAASHYRYLVSRNGKLSVFLNGWLNRAKELGRVG